VKRCQQHSHHHFNNLCTTQWYLFSYQLQHHYRFTALFPAPPGWAGARRKLLDFMVQGKTKRGRHTNHPAGCHSIWTNQCPPPPSPIFYRPDALPVAQPTVSKHWRQANFVKISLRHTTSVLVSICFQGKHCLSVNNLQTENNNNMCNMVNWKLH